MATDTKNQPEAGAEVVFPRSLANLYPIEAQQLYIEAYKKSMANNAKATAGSLTLESSAARDAWEAMQREFVQDPVTHKVHRVGEVAAEPTSAAKRSLFDSVKGLFKR